MCALPIDRHIETLVQLAVDGKDTEFLKIVDDNQIINKADKNGHTPLFIALFGSPILVNEILKRGSDIHRKDNSGMTPLISASMFGYHKAVKLLLEKGANVNATMEDGNPAIKVAIVSASANALPTENRFHHQFDATIQELIQNGADTSIIDHYGAPLLLYPVFNKNYSICEILLKAKADPNFVYKGSSLLAIARNFSSPEIVKLLIDYGAK